MFSALKILASAHVFLSPAMGVSASLVVSPSPKGNSAYIECVFSLSKTCHNQQEPLDLWSSHINFPGQRSLTALEFDVTIPLLHSVVTTSQPH